MAMTPSQLSIIVSSKGVADATVELDKLAKAAASVDAETKSFVIAQSKLAESNKKVSQSSEATARGVTTQELAMIKLHEAANKMNAAYIKQEEAQKKLINGAIEKALKEQADAAAKVAKAQEKLEKSELAAKLREQTKEAAAAKKEMEALAREADKLAKAQDKITKSTLNAEMRAQEKAMKATARAAAELEKAHGDALEMNKKITAQRVAASAKESSANQLNARGITDYQLSIVKAHEAANKMNEVIDKKNKKLQEQADNLKNASHHGNIFNNTLRSMATAALAYMGVNFFAGIIKDADAWSMMQSKLDLAVGSMAVAKNVQNDLYEMSQRLRVPLEDSVKLFTRMAPPLQKMGLGIKDTKQVVESFSTALKLAGATGQEASSAMLQFSQAINAGRLNGGEFNSIAEASPNVLRAIEKELVRTGRGAELAAKGLKNLAADGKLTTEVLVNALKNAAPQWKKDFESLPLTVDGALQRIKNSWLKVIGDLGQSTKFNEKMAASIGKLEEILPTIANAFVGAFTLIVDHGTKVLTLLSSILAVLTLYKTAAIIQTFLGAASAAGALAGSLAAVRAGMLAIGLTPVGLALTAFAGIVGLVAYNWDTLTKSISKTDEVNTKVMQSSGDIVKGIQAENIALEVQIDKLRRANEKQEKYNNTKLEGVKIDSQKELDELNRGLKVLENNLKDAEKAAKAVQGGSLFDPAKISKTQKAREDVAETQKAIDMQKRLIMIASTEQQKNARLDAERAQEQREKDVRDKVTAIYQAAKTEKQLLDEEFKKKKDAAKQDYEKLGYDKMYYNQELLNIDKDYYKQLETINKKVKKPKVEEDVDNINKLHSELDLRDKIIKSVEEYTKIQGKQTVVAINSQEGAQAELDKVNALIDGYSDKKQALVDLQITEAIAEQNAKSGVVRTMQEVFALSEKIRILKELKGAQGTLSGLDTGKKDLENAQKIMDDLMNPTKVDKWESSMSKGLKGIVKGFVDVAKAMEKYGAKQAAITKDREAYNLVAKSGTKSEIELLDMRAAIEEKDFNYRLSSYGEMADAAKGFFEEGSKGYKTLDGISKVVHAAQLARNLVEMGQLAVKAVMNQAGGDPYSAWARMGAMAAAVAALGFAVGGGFNKSAGGMTAADVQKTQGGGTVFGDTEAKSESISKSIEMLKASYDKLYPVNQKMLSSLQSIEASMTGLANLIVKQGGIAEGSNLGIKEGTLSKSSMSWTTALILGGVTAPILKLLGGLWGKTTQNIVDSGLQFGGSLSDMQKGQGFNQYASVDTTTSRLFGAIKNTTNKVETQGLSDEISKQLGLVFTNMQTALEEAGKTLYGSSTGITNALNNMVMGISKISLKGLSGDDVTKAINNVISKALDQMAVTAFTNLDKFESIIGEGYAQKVIRIASTFATVNATMEKFNFKLFEMNDAGIQASLTFSKMFGTLQEMQQITGSYFENFYREEDQLKIKTEAVTKIMKSLGQVMPTTREGFKELVDNAQKIGNTELVANLMKVSDAFADVVKWVEKAAEASDKMDYNEKGDMFPDWTTQRDSLKASFEELSQSAQKWLTVSKQASDIRASINTLLWGNTNTQEAAVKKSEKLWKMMSTDITVEQKLSLAGELKDAIISKYQLERESVTKLIDFSKQLRTYVDGLKLGSLSPLTMTQKLAEARKQYETTLAKAKAGDTTAQGALTGSASAYLEIAKTAYASSDAYQSIFMNITSTLESMTLDTKTADEKLLEINQRQEAELIKMIYALDTIESVADSYYKTALQGMSAQLKALQDIYTRMGVFDGVTAELNGLPAEIAAALSGTFGRTSGKDYVEALYSKFAGKTGNQIDKQGMDYWTREFELYGRDYVLKAFQDSVAKTTKGIDVPNSPFAPAPMMPPSQASVLTEQVATLKEEIIKLREDAQMQTIALMETLTLTSKQNADRIVEGTTEGMDKNNPNWNKATLT